jgi:hypothetical protein
MVSQNRLADWISGKSDDTNLMSVMVSQNRLADWISGKSDDRHPIFPMPLYIDWQIGFLESQMIEI